MGFFYSLSRLHISFKSGSFSLFTHLIRKNVNLQARRRKGKEKKLSTQKREKVVKGNSQRSPKKRAPF